MTTSTRIVISLTCWIATITIIAAGMDPAGPIENWERLAWAGSIAREGIPGGLVALTLAGSGFLPWTLPHKKT